MAIRNNVVTLVLVGLFGVLIISMVMKKREPHAVTIEEPKPAASASASSSALASAPAASTTAPPIPAKLEPTLKRPLRVVSLGWETLAPAVLENGGLESGKSGGFSKAGVAVGLSIVDSSERANQALARGGADESGADVALMPLSGFVASYEKLRALDPVIFHVSHWSRGREVLTTKDGKPLDALPKKGKIKLSPADWDSATFAALFWLDAAGVDPERIELLSNDDPKGDVHARMRVSADHANGIKQSDAVLSTAEASRLMPVVAIAQRGFIQKHTLALKTFMLGFLRGQKTLRDDAAASARQISKLDDAPEPVELLGGIGEFAPVSLSENAELFRLSGRGAVTVETLLSRGFRLWRAAKLSSSPAPQGVVADGRIVALLIRSSRVTQGSVRPKVGVASETAKALLVHRQRGASLDEDALLSELGLLAGIFPRSPLVLTVHRGGATDKKRSQELVEQATDRFDLSPGRLSVGKIRPRPQTQATLEVMPIP